MEDIFVGRIVKVNGLPGEWRVLFITKETEKGNCTLIEIDRGALKGRAVTVRNIKDLKASKTNNPKAQ